MVYYSALKKKRKRILRHATTWVSLENIMLSVISQSQKDKSCMTQLDLTRVVKLTEIGSRMVVARG